MARRRSRTDQTNTIADLTVNQAENAEEMANQQADTVDQAKPEPETLTGEDKKEQTRHTYTAEREETNRNTSRLGDPMRV